MSDLKTVLWVTSYFPPRVNVATNRNIKFLKYLPQFGWKAIVVCPRENVSGTEAGDRLLVQLGPAISVAAMPRDPFLYLDDRRGTNQLARYLSYFMNNFIPPDGHYLWSLLAAGAVDREIIKHKPDVVYVSCSPFSLNILGAWIKYKYKIPWVSDFRDLWTLNPTPKRFFPSYDRFVSRRLEKLYLRYCDALIVNTENSRGKMIGKYEFLREKISVIPNGYDPEDLPVEKNESKISGTFFFGGSIYQNTDYTPLAMLRLLSRLAEQGCLNKTWELHYAGSDGDALGDLIQKEQINVEYLLHGYLDHKSLYRLISRMEYVILCMPDKSDTTSWIPARLYDYIANNSRLICFMSRGSEVDQLLAHYGNGVTLYYDEPENVQISKIMHFVADKRERGEEVSDLTKSFSRKELTRKLADLLEKIAGGYGRGKTDE
jgi:glycosyltransferase involved in cell wall biosynthesis